jgi:acyl-CoA reductase-like NAD-dependent aldehyde dehydrogenase
VSSVVSPPASATDEIVVRNPATGETLYTIPEPNQAQIDAVYARAEAAFEVIRKMSVRQRIDESRKLQRYVLENREAIMDRVCEETGKARTDALISEIFPVLDIIGYYAKNAEKFLADRKVPTPIVLMGKKSKIYFEPIGPVLIISPWNYPFHLTLIPFVCAFIAGNPVVFKPSEYTPLRGLVEEVVEKSGFMKDALQVVYGGKDTGKRLIDGKPSKVFFTGSTRAGRQVMAQAAQYLIPVELELGGKDPMIIFDDVNLKRTVNGALWGSMTNSGQTCTSVERVYVQEGIFDEFVKMMGEKADRLTSLANDENATDGGGLDVGCMTAGFQVEKVEEHVQDAVAKGAQIVSGGKRRPNSHAFQPTIVANVDDSMRIASEETFGPIVTIQKFETEDEAVELANKSAYGLSASVWSTDLERADRVARGIQTGNVSINNVLSTQGNPALPFGGTKHSGFGRYKGPFGLHSFSNVKSIMVDKQGGNLELNWFPYTKEKYDIFSKLLVALYSGGPFAIVKAALLGMKLEKLSKARRL